MKYRKHLPSSTVRHKKPFAERVDDALGGRTMAFEQLALVLYPDPKSHRYQSNGGPPGCYMALSRGLRLGGFFVSYKGGRIVHPRSKG